MTTQANPVENVFSQRANVLNSVCDARLLFSDKTTTLEQFEKAQEVLAFAYLYCPTDLQDVVLATMNESEIRLSHRIF